jgi:hypothetical protein
MSGKKVLGLKNINAFEGCGNESLLLKRGRVFARELKAVANFAIGIRGS